jgi:hypothetical protein
MTNKPALFSLIPSSHHHPDWSTASFVSGDIRRICKHCKQPHQRTMFDDGDIFQTHCFCGCLSFTSHDVEGQTETVMNGIKRLMVTDENDHSLLVFFQDLRNAHMKYNIYKAAHIQSIKIKSVLFLDDDPTSGGLTDAQYTQHRDIALAAWLHQDMPVHNQCSVRDLHYDQYLFDYIEHKIKHAEFSADFE